MSNTCAYRQIKFDEFLTKENRNLKRIPGNDGQLNSDNYLYSGEILILISNVFLVNKIYIKEHHREKRFRLQHTGYIDTLAQLCKLPATEHDPRSFKLDIDFFSPNMIKFSLSGVYKEGKVTDKVRPYRSFHRAFVCIPDPAAQ